MKKIRKIFETVRNYFCTRHMFEKLDEIATQRIVNRIIDDAAFVTRNKREFWSFVAREVNTDLGECYEFGVFEGRSINFLAQELGTEIHGFDSFEGLPSGEGVWKKYHEEKTFDREGKLPKVVPGVKLHKGWISETLPAFIASTSLKQTAFIHIDTDVYESAACILDNLGPYIKSETVIIFDEFCNYEGFFLHEYQAFNRFLKIKRLNYEIIAACSIGPRYGSFMKIAVKIL